MLKKLYKHEFGSLYRTMLPIYGGLCLLALLSRICFLVLNTEEEDILFYGLVKGSSAMIYGVGMIAMMIIAVVLVIKRFYTNCFSKEGYLTFSLPFTATEHLVCKLVCGTLTIITTVLAGIVSLIILGLGTSLMKELFDSIALSVKAFFTYFTAGQAVTYIILGLLIALVVPVGYLLQFYFCAAFGQRFKNRIAASIITYFVLYAVMQMASTMLLVPVSLVTGVFLDRLAMTTIIPVIMVLILVLELAYSTVFFLLTRYQMKNKLNLA